MIYTLCFMLGLTGAGAWLWKRKRSAFITIGGIAGATIIGVVAGGGEPFISQVPTPPIQSEYMSLVATRDLDTSTPCDMPAGGIADNAPPVTDQSWTRTGGQSCYPISASTAQCFDATEVPYTVDATGLGWVLPGAGLVNRVLYSTAITCANWTCRGTGNATSSQPDPAGGSAASSLTVGGVLNDVYKLASGYSASATVYPRVWLKCSTGTLRVLNPAGIGEWRVDCAAASAGSWVLVNAAPATGVTLTAAFGSTAGGQSGFHFIALSGTVSVDVWAPTATEGRGVGTEVVPTAAAAVDTGTAVWIVDNSSGRYWQTGWTLLESITTVSGTTWAVDGTNLRITGAAGSPRAGILYSLEAHP